MLSLATALGLRASPLSPDTLPNHAPGYLIFHFIFAYGLLSSRTLKQYYGIDHNAAPREDLDRYGEAAVRCGRLTRGQLAMLRRNEAAHANAVENYALFVAAVGFATVARVEREYVNRAALVYTAARVAYGAVYILVDHPLWSQIRGVTWWTGNLSCLWLLWRAWDRLAGGS
ncbi:hypothetical protein F4775DRAFT_550406 [Biscogniauxia sp. FL1348]|nr:hypothetical protein F4775DRAFT_550406 [Biscogniauxia sp. FL1348]